MKKVCDHLSSGGVIAYPTESIWGLGVDMNNPQAVDRLYEIKGRESTKAVSILVRDVMAAKEIVHFDKKIEELMYIYWPGPLTFVLPHKEGVSSDITGGTGKLGLRCSSHPKVKELVEAFDGYLTTTSANISGQPAATQMSELDWLPEDVMVVKDDTPTKGVASSVITFENDELKVLREGAWAEEFLLDTWEKQ